MHTPTSPVNLAWAEAMNAAISSWRTCTNFSVPSLLALSTATSRPAMPSPG